MRSIWKFPLLVVGEQVISVPVGSVPISAQFQRGTLCLWAFVETEAETVEQTIHIYGTGGLLPDDDPGIYVGTVQEGDFVWHVYWVSP